MPTSSIAPRPGRRAFRRAATATAALGVLGAVGCDITVTSQVACASGTHPAEITVSTSPDKLSGQYSAKATYTFSDLFIAEWPYTASSFHLKVQRDVARTLSATSDLPVTITPEAYNPRTFAPWDPAGPYTGVVVKAIGRRLPTFITFETWASELPVGSSVEWWTPSRYSTSVDVPSAPGEFVCNVAGPDQIVARQYVATGPIPPPPTTRPALRPISPPPPSVVTTVVPGRPRDDH